MRIGRRESTEVSEPQGATAALRRSRSSRSSVALDLDLDLFRVQSQGVTADRAASTPFFVGFGVSLLGCT